MKINNNCTTITSFTIRTMTYTTTHKVTRIRSSSDRWKRFGLVLLVLIILVSSDNVRCNAQSTSTNNEGQSIQGIIQQFIQVILNLFSRSNKQSTNNPSTTTGNNNEEEGPVTDSIVTEPSTTSTIICPEIPPETFCAEYWDPHICFNGSCHYSNGCWAITAGVNITTQCYQKCPMIEYPNDKCSLEDATGFYTCKEDCSYSSKCEIEQIAGFDFETDCIEQR